MRWVQTVERVRNPENGRCRGGNPTYHNHLFFFRQKETELVEASKSPPLIHRPRTSVLSRSVQHQGVPQSFLPGGREGKVTERIWIDQLRETLKWRHKVTGGKLFPLFAMRAIDSLDWKTPNLNFLPRK